MSTHSMVPDFVVLPGRAVRRALNGREKATVDLVEATYRLHGAGQTVNPPSRFLRLADRPGARIIALPAWVGGQVDTAGLKWVASFPGNVDAGLPRASAAMFLNDRDTGYPYACLEGSIISATRTAASAALGALRPTVEIGVYDTSAERAEAFGDHLRRCRPETPVRVHADPRALIGGCDLVVFATTAGTPHVVEPSWFDHAPLVLHLSLRDLGPDVVLRAVNVVDDIDHVVREGTSVHLAAQRTGGSQFVDATLYDVLTGAFTPPEGRTVIFSPFGLGVLDVALADFVHRECLRSGDHIGIDGFFDGVADEADRVRPTDGLMR